MPRVSVILTVYNRASMVRAAIDSLLAQTFTDFELLVVDDGRAKHRYHLNRSYYGLYMPRMIWRELENFSSGSVSLVLASAHYEESDYYREYTAFAAAKAEGRDPSR